VQSSVDACWISNGIIWKKSALQAVLAGASMRNVYQKYEKTYVRSQGESPHIFAVANLAPACVQADLALGRPSGLGVKLENQPSKKGGIQ